MAKLVDLTGMRFGNLEVVGRAKSTNKNAKWLCKCDCGGQNDVQSGHLRSGAIVDCGCSKSARMTKHGQSRSSEFQTWRNMRARCSNPKSANYRYYGGRGIEVCESWSKSYEAFIRDMGLKPSPSHTIERINNDLGYSPENCKWALMTEQSKNKRPFGTAGV